MWPNMLLLEPTSAASQLQYRFNRKDEALEYARNNGRPGLQFPWESAFTGVECCAGNGKILKWGLYEQHINGDIAYAMQQYYWATRDINWLRSLAFPVIKGLAEFWAGRATPNPDGSYSLNEVMGPDEFHAPVNDSFYTNAVAKQSLLFAIEAAQLLHEPIENNWTTIAKGLRILTADGHHQEFRNYTGDTVKQADVILLGFPILYKMDRNIRIADLLYYANRTTLSGPAMTWAMFAVGWLDAVYHDRAQHFFKQGYANVQEPFKVWRETPTGGAINFITGAGTSSAVLRLLTFNLQEASCSLCCSGMLAPV